MKAGITAYSVANTIRLNRTQWKGSVVISEGDTDARILNRFIDPSACRLAIAHGKDNALGALSLLKQGTAPGILTLVDKDCILLDPALASNPDVLVTDTHDLETMMLQSPALEKVLVEFGSDAKIQAMMAAGKDVRGALSEAALPIGLLRLSSLRHNLNLKFDGCNFGAFVDKDTLNVDSVKLVTEIINKTRNHQLQPADLVKLIDLERANGMDKWDVCCGHDLSEVLSIGLRKLIGSCKPSDVNPTVMERSFRLAYEGSYFKMTQLYKALKGWEARNDPYRILL